MQKIFLKIKKIKFKNKRGVSLVIAITVTTLLLSVSLSISNIVLRQIRINTVNNSSKPAFFAADSAAECAFYYDTASTTSSEHPDININADFSTSVFGPDIIYDGEESAVEFLTNLVACGDGEYGAISSANKIIEADKVTSTFDIDYGNMCAKVEVVKTDVDTQITARGYNTKMGPTGCDLTDIDSRRIVERGLTIKY